MALTNPPLLTPSILKPPMLGGNSLGQFDSGSSAGSTNAPGDTSGSGSGSSLSEFDTEDDTSQEDRDYAKEREFLSTILSVMGFSDLPGTRTDLTNQAHRMVQLQQQIGATIQELQKAGIGVDDDGQVIPPAGPMQGIAQAAAATKISALNDLQLQLKDAGVALKNYAYSFFSGTEKPLNLSSSTILQAYSKNLLSKDQTKARLAEAGMAPRDIDIVIGLEDKQTAEDKAKNKKGLDADTIVNALESGAISKQDGTKRLLDLGFSQTDINVVLKMLELKAKRAAEDEKKKAKGTKSSSSSGGGSGSSSGSSSGGSSGSVNVNVKVDTAALAREALNRARSR